MSTKMPEMTDDDDILDLTDIVSDGKPQFAMPPIPDDPGSIGDFGADLDALLDSLIAEAPAGSHPEQSRQEQSLPAPAAAPIADTNPVDHVVDALEELPEPQTADIDSLLAELGVSGNSAPETVAPATPPASPAPKAEAVPATDLEKTLPSPPIPAEIATDGIDLNELDALLDNMLATAPAPGPAPGQTPGLGASAPEPVQIPEAALPLEADAQEEPVKTVDPVASQAMDQALAAVNARLAALEESLAALAEERTATPSASEDLEARLEAATAPGSPLLDKLANSVAEALSGKFSADLEKMTAAAAARVIREEIAALLKE